MNVIYLGKYTLNNFHASAGAKRVLNQVKYLETQNNVIVITLSKYKSSYNYNINFKRYDNKLLQVVLLPFYWIRICALLISNMQKEKNIILLESLVELNFSLPILCAKMLGYKIVHDVVENFFIIQENNSKSQLGNSFISRIFYRLTPLYTDGIIVISDKLLQLYSKFKIPIIKIYNSIEPHKINGNGSGNSKDFTFLYSGTFGIKDGVKDLIIAFNQISRSYPNVRLVMTGINKSTYYQECLSLIKKNDKISYLGYLNEEDLHQAYQNADVLVITRDKSLFADSGFPYKLSEYLTYQKPVISSSVSDIPSLFTENVDILLTRPSDIESIIEKMIYSINHKAELACLAINGYNKGNEYFSITKNGKMLYNFLISL